MSKFKVGDKVKVNVQKYPELALYQNGTVISVETGPYEYYVTFPDSKGLYGERELLFDNAQILKERLGIK